MKTSQFQATLITHILSTELSIPLTNRSLYLAHDLIVGNCFSTLVVGDDLRLLINFLRKIFN